jgi:hypothetical protein
MSSNGRASLCLGSQQNSKGIILTMRPTMRAPDGWWAPPKKASPGEEFVPFRWLVLPAAGNAHRWAFEEVI